MNEIARLGVCYYPEHWPQSQWQDDAQRMRDVGLSVVRIGEFSWSRLEAEAGSIDFDWLQRAVDTLAMQELAVVLGTPTATPPAWLVQRMPDMLAVTADGTVRKFGSRRHYCFSHQGYRRECQRIATLMAKHFGEHEAVIGWQIDNEYGCHDTTLSWSASALREFRLWLAKKYESISELNDAWGNVFWSMEYRSFEEIELPCATVTEANPAHRMDFRRFSSDQVISFNRLQADIIRPLSPGRDIIHNFMGRIVDFDHFELGADLDISSWDAYPLGFLADRSDRSREFKKKFVRAGDPDFQAFHHDLYRATSKGRWWVMEQQPGPVNWAASNPSPREGMVRLWSWEAIAHGAEVVSYFRWRQLPFAQEQMHSGLVRSDNVAAPAMQEAKVVDQELQQIGSLPQCESEICLVFDYSSAWAWDIQPHAEGFDYFAVTFRFYCALRRLGLSVDFVDARTGSLDGYSLVLVPALFSWNQSLLDALSACSGIVLIGPRSGSKTDDFAIPATLPPALDAQMLDLKVVRVDSMPPDCPIEVADYGRFEIWREIIEHGAACDVVMRCEDGEAAVLRQGSKYYIAGLPDSTLLHTLIDRLCQLANIETVELPDAIRMRRRGNLVFIFNYGDQTFELSDLALSTTLPEEKIVLGTKTLPASGVTIVRLDN